MKLPKNNNRKAFTLLEVICVLIIISIVSSIALPALDNFYSSDRCKAEASIFVSNVRFAKYEAMQDNCLIRLVFSPENDINSGNIFKIEKFIVAQLLYNNEIEDTYFDIDEVIINNRVIDNDNENSVSQDYDSIDWINIGEYDEIQINSTVEVDISSVNLAKKNNLMVIYFKPDGFLYDANNDKISEQRIIFKYGNSAIAVDINALGVISSEAIPSDENEFDDKDEKEEDENED